MGQQIFGYRWQQTYFFSSIVLLIAIVIFNLPFRDPTGSFREWNFSLHKRQGVRTESPWLTDDLCGKVLIRTGHCLACPPQSASPAALSASHSFTLPAGDFVTQASSYPESTHAAFWACVSHTTRQLRQNFSRGVIKADLQWGKNTSSRVKASLKVLLVDLTEKPA